MVMNGNDDNHDDDNHDNDGNDEGKEANAQLCRAGLVGFAPAEPASDAAAPR
jgi:hypothetical protein